MIAANNGHLLAFDNLSGLPAWLSMHSAGLRAAVSRSGSSTPMMKRCCLKRRVS